MYAIYRQQYNSEVAASFLRSTRKPLLISGLVLYEFRQSVRLQVWLNSQDKTKGFPRGKGDQIFAQLHEDLNNTLLIIATADWPDVHRIAEKVSKEYTMSEGYRSFDLLHVATAIHLGAVKILSFDIRQRKLAMAEGLELGP